MKKRKILVLFPFLGLLLSGCTLQEALGNVKDWTNGHIIDPIKNLFNGGEKEEQQDEDEHKGDEGGETEVTIRYIELEDYPHEVIQNKVIEPKDVSIKVVYSDLTDKTEHPDEVICDTSKVGETEVVAKYKGEECSGKITVKEAPVTEHAGTEEDPFTGKDAVTIAQSLPESSKDDKHPSEQSYYIKGVVGALLEEFNPSFGNFTFTIEENFEGYRLKFGPNYTAFKNATDLEVGDTVTMYAQILNFKGTYETSGGYITKIEKPAIEANLTEITIEGNPQTTYLAGAAYNHNGLTATAHYDNDETQDVTLAATWEISKATAEMGDESIKITAHYKEFSAELVVNVTVQDDSKPVHAGTLEDPYTGLDAALVASKLEESVDSKDKKPTEDSYYIKDTVTQIIEFSESYGNFTFMLGDNFEAYRLKNGANKENFTSADQIQVGDTVTVYAQILNWKGTYETEGGYVASIDRPIVDVESVSLDRNELNMEVGMPDETLVATVAPANATNKSVTWESSNPEVATVSEGVVHAVAAGDAVITVKSAADSTKTAACSVHVTQPEKELTSIEVTTMPTVEYTEGELLDLSGMVVTLHYDDQSSAEITSGWTTNIAADHELTLEDTSLVVSFGGFSAEAITLTITAKPQPTHAGTAEDPYTGEDAVIVANNLAAGGVTDDSYYIKGVVVSFEENFNPSYGNYSFKIDGGFIGWRLLNGEGKAKFSTGDLEIGDIVTMYVQIQSYIKNAGDTPKPESKNGYIVSIEKPFIAPETIEITSGSEVAVGGTLTLAATVGPVGAAQDVEWTIVTGGEYATLSDGVLTGVVAGDVVVKATATGYESVTTQKTISVTADAPVTISDELTRATTGVTGTSYTEWSGKSVNSTAVYAGQSAGGNESIQLRSKNSNSGIVTTASGGTLKKIIVVWNSNTQANNKIDIYGDTSAYSSPTELYGTIKGTKLGSIEMGVSTELEISGEYTFVGVRSNNNAVYLTSITFVWG